MSDDAPYGYRKDGKPRSRRFRQTPEERARQCREKEERRSADPIRQERRKIRGRKQRLENLARSPDENAPFGYSAIGKPRKCLPRQKSKNPRAAKLNEKQRARFAIKIRAMPPWADRRALLDVYRLCEQMKSATGERWVVDHIIPLISPTVCGLHVAHNLRVVRYEENARKLNYLREDWGFAPTVFWGADGSSTRDLEYVAFGPLCRENHP